MHLADPELQFGASTFEDAIPAPDFFIKTKLEHPITYQEREGIHKHRHRQNVTSYHFLDYFNFHQ